jgi:hypothetical protein
VRAAGRRPGEYPNAYPFWSNVLDLEGDDIAAAQLAVDGHIEQRPNRGFVLRLATWCGSTDMLWSQWRLCADELALVPRGVATGVADFSRDSMVMLLDY